MMTVLDHLLELRSKVFISCIAVFIGACVAHYYHDILIGFLIKPMGDQKLIFLSPLDPLFFILKTDMFAGVILALPILNWCFFSFVKPAMQTFNWIVFSLFYCIAAVCIVVALAYAYFVMVPISLTFLLSINVANIQNMITATSYLNFLLAQSLIIAIIFQIPLFIVAGSMIGAVKPSFLASKRRYIYVGGLIVLAVITPTTDLFNLSIIALPAAIIFEGSLLAGRIIEWSSRRRAAARKRLQETLVIEGLHVAE